MNTSIAKPKRIQRRRTKGWRMPEGAIYVGRPTKWGNPYNAETLIYSVPKNMLLGAGASETKNPKDTRQLLADLVKEATKEMRKQGLAVK